MEENKKRGKKKTEKSEIELLFVDLCHVNKERRDTGIKALTDYIKKKKVPLDGHNLSYICKGLFYYYWLCYSSEEQKIAACKISKILRNIDEVDKSEEKKGVFLFLQNFLRVMSSKYDSLDLYRLNKFLFLFKVFQAECLLFLHRYSWRSDYIKRYNKIMLRIFDDTNDVFYNHIDTFFKEFFGNQFYLKAKDQNEKVHIKNFLLLMDFFFKIICKTERKHIIDVIRNKIFSVILKLNVGKNMLEKRICRYLGKCKNPYATKVLRGFYNSFVAGHGERGGNKQKCNKKDKKSGSKKTPIFVENFEATGAYNGSASAPSREEEQISRNNGDSHLTTPRDGAKGGEKQLDGVLNCKKRSKRDRASNEFNRLRAIIEEGDDAEMEDDLSSDLESDIGSDEENDIGMNMGKDRMKGKKKKVLKRKREENGNLDDKKKKKKKKKKVNMQEAIIMEDNLVGKMKSSSKKNKKEIEKKKKKKKNKDKYNNGEGSNAPDGEHASSSIEGKDKHKLNIIDFIQNNKRGFSGSIILENKGKSDLPIYSIDKSDLQGGCIQGRKLKVNKHLKKKNSACSASSDNRVCQTHPCYTLLTNDEGEDDICLQLENADRGDVVANGDHKNVHIGMIKKKIVKSNVEKSKKGKKMEKFAKLGKMIKLAKQGKLVRLAKQSKLAKLAKRNKMAKIAKQNKKSKTEKKNSMIIGQGGEDKNKSALSNGVATDAKGKIRERRKNGIVKKTILKKGKTKSHVTKRVHFNLNKNTIEYIPRIKKKNVNSYFFLDNFRNLINVPAFL
ncbi:nucleolar protein Nop52, putative [Plasmodium knowlesi strain H]|uniref:Nucleolar protein Nop52, putative n=3 Tax=Plasmodium knowlesi TaxID=5850 RepID=A0A5K1V5M6_PLAKH|nr:nucleolar protein Nop52, putative [Plasmodium knowlesi strain H]OTN67325.1 putative Nucleolar protein Nop52 [Plasmodium knowlesi]CAA9987589.1 nucleolar protein Nop52, putative [Plasmodium knowlesi strain H]SBO27016.1 nucleolar protein Nop52, putative [Plasmodium knowlesi strain H]SBO29226.1 nucleolar protein Nop52, putative [Plasmodium knowlesi strain H]VVS77063.1 nucleolar protein Nop52, putative [Plasmodium knowlesi strain H]|eukprot:XP_002258591.1 nucleolar protein, putative [Plasmodium knowlesi strain H]